MRDLQHCEFSEKGTGETTSNRIGSGWTIKMASDKGLDARQLDYKKGIFSPGSLGNNPVR